MHIRTNYSFSSPLIWQISKRPSFTNIAVLYNLRGSYARAHSQAEKTSQFTGSKAAKEPEMIPKKRFYFKEFLFAFAIVLVFDQIVMATDITGRERRKQAKIAKLDETKRMEKIDEATMPSVTGKESRTEAEDILAHLRQYQTTSIFDEFRGIRRLDCITFASNAINEDQYIWQNMEMGSKGYWFFNGIYDGHM